MPESLNRYHNKIILEHLAHQYVLGLLISQVSSRIEKLLLTNQALEQRITYWQDRFSSFDKQTAELEPKVQTWQNIKQTFEPQIKNIATASEKPTHFWSWLSLSINQVTSALLVIVIVLLSYLIFIQKNNKEQLSYVAVLTTKNHQAQLIVSSYEQSHQLIINVINTPKITIDQDLEIWAISKNGKLAHSLGIIQQNTRLIQKPLSTEQWHLIKNSKSLLVTVESLGGSLIAKPSELVVSRGLSVHLNTFVQDMN